MKKLFLILLSLCSVSAQAENLDIQSSFRKQAFETITNNTQVLTDINADELRTMLTNAIAIAANDAYTNANARAAAISNALTQAANVADYLRSSGDSALSNRIETVRQILPKAIYNPDDANKYIDGAGNIYVISNLFEITFSEDFRDEINGEMGEESYAIEPYGSLFEDLPGFDEHWVIGWATEGSNPAHLQVERSYSDLHYNIWKPTTNSYVLNCVPGDGGFGYAIARPYSTTNLTGSTATQSYVSEAISAHDTEKELHIDSFTNIVWRSVYSNGWQWLVAYTNYPAI